jgi:uncharacterized protein
MTPQERQLIAQLFDRLATLESSPRDPDAEAMIREGWRRAPNAAYALVQTVLLQDEALKAANARIQQYEQGGEPPREPEQRGFLDSMRDSIFGRDEPRGSVPRVPPRGLPPQETRQDTRQDPWGRQGAQPGSGYGAPPGYQGGTMQPPPPSGGGGSFLGTAAAAAAGVIGGSLLMNGIRSAMGGHQAGAFSGAFDSLNRGDHSPWGGGAAGSDLSREAGLGDIGSRRTSAFDQAQQDRDADEDADADEMDDADYASDGGYDGGSDDTA